MNLQLHPHSEFENVYLSPNRERLYLHTHLMSAPNPSLSTDRGSPVFFKTFDEDQGIHLNYMNGLLPDRFPGHPMSPHNPHGFLTHHHIGELPPRIPSPMREPRSNIPSPINMISQTARKLEIKRERNRAAAQRCRKKKLEKIAALEYKVKLSKDEIKSLENELRRLTDDVDYLKKSIKKHHDNGCVLDASRFDSPDKYDN